MKADPLFLERTLSGWGRHPRHTCRVFRPDRDRDLDALAGVLPRGMGRSYGDAALDDRKGVVLTERLNRILAFDPETGLVSAEGGMTLGDLGALLLPQGWFLPVTPGTKFVSIGGAVASDVHGKNHHVDGSFSRHVNQFELLTPDGGRQICSRAENPTLFKATIGGMGLTGTIARVDFRLRRVPGPMLRVWHRSTPDLEKLFQALADPRVQEPYTVAWVDCLAKGRSLGRGIFMAGDHVEATASGRTLPSEPLLTLPIDLPSWVLNPVSLRAFNALYYRLQTGKDKPFLSAFDPFFYPLDILGGWNRIYGRQGFIQYQCVLPERSAFDGMTRLLEAISAAGAASFLAVLKRLGHAGEGLLGFPRPGYTLALDLPFRPSSTPELVRRLDAIVLTYSGNINLCKDSCLDAESFRVMNPLFSSWIKTKEAVDPNWRLQSNMSRRLDLQKGL